VSLTVTVLGSQGVYATRERACAGYLLELGDTKIWMDAGSGSWRNLLDHIDYNELDGVLISHRHPDHTTDVFQAYHARFWGQSEPLDRIPLWAPGETIDRLVDFYGDSEESFDMHVVAAGAAIEIGDAHVSFFEMAHPPETIGVRIVRDGAVLAYSADSGPDADFDGLAGDAGLFVCEATLQDLDHPWEGHLQASQAGKIGSSVGCNRLLLTHLPPGRSLDLSLEEARRTAGDLDVSLAYDGLRLEVTSDPSRRS
jgi:ribonuclease BN (tRNA processing enzyme)